MAGSYGKYRGAVVDNLDPMQLGRIIPLVPAISATPLGWALPCAPFAGPDAGFFAMPPINANVWIEFEGGDPNYPIWSGCFWSPGEAPVRAESPETTLLQTRRGLIRIDDAATELRIGVETPQGRMRLSMGPGGIRLGVAESRIEISAEAIVIQNGAARIAVTPSGVEIVDGE